MFSVLISCVCMFHVFEFMYTLTVTFVSTFTVAFIFRGVQFGAMVAK